MRCWSCYARQVSATRKRFPLSWRPPPAVAAKRSCWKMDYRLPVQAISISELVAVSDKCLLTSTDKDELPDLSSLLAYGDKRAMLDRLITETERICRLSGKSWRGMTARRWTNGYTVSEVHGLLSVLTNPCGTSMNCCIKNLNVPKWNCGNAWMPCFVWEQLS